MDSWTVESEAAFDGYVEALIGVIGHADRAEPLRDYCLGLMLPVERKSVEPLAAVTAPLRVCRPSISRCCTLWGMPGCRTKRSWVGFEIGFCRTSSGMGRSEPG